MDEIEDRYESIESALNSISSAIEELKNADEDDARLSLQDIEWDLKQKLKDLGEVLDQREREELDYMNREYERMTM